MPVRRRMRTETPPPPVNPPPVAPPLASVPGMGERRRLQSKQPPPEAYQNPNQSDAGHLAGARPRALRTTAPAGWHMYQEHLSRRACP